MTDAIDWIEREKTPVSFKLLHETSFLDGFPGSVKQHECNQRHKRDVTYAAREQIQAGKAGRSDGRHF
jgi:hypothetical protein